MGLSLSLASLLPGAALADLKVDLSEDVVSNARRSLLQLHGGRSNDPSPPSLARPVRKSLS